MSNFVQTLEETENRLFSKFYNVSMLVETLIELDNLIENNTDEIDLELINALKNILKQQLAN